MSLSYGSVCAGIEAASVAVHPLGWRPAWFAEIEPQPCAVLAHHYPDVPNLGDMTTIAARILAGEIEAPDVLVGGTPCQSYSVAGRRQGLSDPRGQLTIAFLDLADAIDTARARLGKQPCIIWWENVPGVLSSKDNAFGCFLGGLAGESCELQSPGRKWTHAGCVFGPQRAVAWRALDAQYFGLAQRRRRVFAVASARVGFSPARVLLEFEGLRRDSAPSRGQGLQGADAAGTGAAPAGCWWDGGQVSQTLDAVLHKSQALPEKNRFPAVLQPVCMTGVITHTLTAEGHDASEDGSGRGVPIIATPVSLNAGLPQSARICSIDGVSPTLQASAEKIGWHHFPLVATPNPIAVNARQDPVSGEVTPPLDTHYNTVAVCTPAPPAEVEWIVRFLTPREGERLQGFPDDYTLVPFKGKPMKDGPRRKMIGNSMATTVMHWIGTRIDAEAARTTPANDNTITDNQAVA